MNAMVLEEDGDAILVDCGVTFDDRGLGVDVVHPDFSALDALRVRGVVLTHGHEDHIGALPYLLRRHDVPVYGPKYALGLVRERLAEHEILSWAKLVETTTRVPFEVGPFRIEPVRVTHSIADATALVIETSAGRVVHTGDFKFDDDPPDGERFDEARLREVGDAGVALLLSDSTNVDARGDAAGGERGVGEALGSIVREAKGAVVVAMFASNVHRLRMLGEIAEETRRRIVPLGRSVQTHARVARSTGYIQWRSDLAWPAERARELPRDRVLAIATGTQAESRAALARLARGELTDFELQPGDTVILSARVIPGNEPEVFALLGDLLRRGVELRTWMSDRGVHVSGHAHAGEQRRMLDLVRPRSFVPVHGTLHHLHRHAALARAQGVGDVHVIENGQVIALDARSPTLRRDGTVPTGRVHAFAGRAIAESTLRERMTLAEQGVAFVVVRLDAKGAVAAEPSIVTRGVVDEDASAHVLAEARGEVVRAIDEARFARRGAPWPDVEAIREAARLAVRRAFARGLGFKPVTVVEVVRVPGGSGGDDHGPPGVAQ